MPAGYGAVRPRVLTGFPPSHTPFLRFQMIGHALAGINSVMLNGGESFNCFKSCSFVSELTKRAAGGLQARKQIIAVYVMHTSSISWAYTHPTHVFAVVRLC